MVKRAYHDLTLVNEGIVAEIMGDYLARRRLHSATMRRLLLSQPFLLTVDRLMRTRSEWRQVRSV